MERFAPDIVNTLRRFPWATLLLALATIVFVGLINGQLDKTGDFWQWICAGLLTGVIFALAGRVFAESRPNKINIARLLEYLLPLVVIVAYQMDNYQWVVAPVLAPIGGLWLSVAAFTKVGTKDAREDIQNRFWWFNHRAVTTGVIAIVGFIIISIGVFAIEQSLAVLFGFDVSKLFYEYILPITGVFLAPFYWFSTIPQLEEYRDGELDEPEFLSRAIGFMGQFVLAPLLLIYAIILLAYAAQIMFTRSLPEGTLGWMVLGFTITGAANWLLLHPAFMRSRLLVRLFRAYWFYITIIPIALYAVAVWIRIDTYGLTPERLLLVAGGIWATSLTVAFLSKRFADIRLIPAIAAILLLVVSIGPWNMVNSALLNQGQRLQVALETVAWTAAEPEVEWPLELARQANGAVRYLSRHKGEAILDEIFSPLGVERSEWDETPGKLKEMLHLPPLNEGAWRSGFYLTPPTEPSPVDIGATPIFVGQVGIYDYKPVKLGAWELRLSGADLQFWENDIQVKTVNLTDWIASQDIAAGHVTNPLLTFTVDERKFAVIAQFISGVIEDENPVSSITGQLFTDKMPTASQQDPPAPAQ